MSDDPLVATMFLSSLFPLKKAYIPYSTLIFQKDAIHKKTHVSVLHLLRRHKQMKKNNPKLKKKNKGYKLPTSNPYQMCPSCSKIAQVKRK